MTDLPVQALFCVGFDGLTPPHYLSRWLEAELGGVILFRRNLRDLEQVCRLTAALHAVSPTPLLIGLDQEGGRVTRLPPPFLAPPPAAALGALDDPLLAGNLARAVGRELDAAGFTWNLAPVLDVHTNPANPVIGDRAFSHDPGRVARLGAAVIQGYADAGILATGKHFPGHGDTGADSHLTLPESLQPAQRWRAVEFLPFRQAIRNGVPAILVAHLLCPALDPHAPTSLSPAVITGILREELGFDGIVVSDDLEMAAIAARFDLGEAAIRFIEAGGDLMLICHDAQRQQQAMAAVQAALRSGRLSEDRLARSLDRIARVRDRIGRRRPADMEQARAVIGCAEHRRVLQGVVSAADRA